MLEWDYVACTVDISMPGYIKKKLQEYEHVMGNKKQTCPYSPEPKKYGREAQAFLPSDSSPHLIINGIIRIQQIVGSILVYARAVDMTVFVALSLIAVEQTNATEKNNGTMHPIIGLPFWPLKQEGLILRIGHDTNIHSDALYLSEAKAHSRACGHFSWDGCQRTGNPFV